MKVLLAASEVAGFAKTGGLADVAASLPQALARMGHECAVLLPFYHCTRKATPLERTDLAFDVPVAARRVPGRLWRSQLPGDPPVPVYLVEQPAYFDRDDPRMGQGIYQFTLPNGQKADYPDNCERFVFFCRAVLEAVRLLDFRPDVLHVNDWQTGLVPVLLREDYARREDGELYQHIHTLFTIHNIAYQGLFWHWDMLLTGLDWRLFNPQQLEFYGQLNFLKAGVVFTDLITTVSPMYAREIQTPYYGCGLQGVLRERSDRLFGIVNGVDYRTWNPAVDRHLVKDYTSETVVEGKAACKAALQQQFRLPEKPRTPLLAMVARLVEQKGVELVIKAAPTFLEQDTQLVVLGEGDPGYHRLLGGLQARYPDRLGLVLGFDEALAHRIEAGADLFLMPSQYEPSGLNQLYSMKYGTVPVVRATGGLADTVLDCTPQTLADGTATGFTFGAYNHEALLGAIQRGLETYLQHPNQWLRLIRNGMRQDWSWDRSAREYGKLYERLAGRTPSA